MEHFLEKITPLRHWHVFQWNSLRTSVASSPVWSSGFWRDRVGSQFGFGIRTWVGKGSKFSFYRFGLVSSRTGSKFRLFGGVRMVSNFDFGGSTWVQVSSKFNLSSWKQNREKPKFFPVFRIIIFITIRAHSRKSQLKNFSCFSTDSPLLAHLSTCLFTQLSPFLGTLWRVMYICQNFRKVLLAAAAAFFQGQLFELGK